MIKSTTKKTTKKASSKKANPKSFTRYADLRPKGGGRNSDEYKYSDEPSNQEYYAKLYKLAENIQWEKRNEYPIHGYPWHRALEDASNLLAKKKANPKKCTTIKVRRKISMGKGKRPRILQVRRKICNPSKEIETELDKLEGKKVSLYEKNQLLMKGDLLIPDWFYSSYRVLNRNSGIIETFETTDVKSIDKTNIYL